MDKPYIYEICIEDQLTGDWSDWFDGLVITDVASAHLTRLRGLLPDQSALFGLLSHIHALNLVLVSVNRWEPD